jgi:hypothetical protein
MDPGHVRIGRESAEYGRRRVSFDLHKAAVGGVRWDKVL